jgi:hypothetical protein
VRADYNVNDYQDVEGYMDLKLNNGFGKSEIVELEVQGGLNLHLDPSERNGFFESNSNDTLLISMKFNDRNQSFVEVGGKTYVTACTAKGIKVFTKR